RRTARIADERCVEGSFGTRLVLRAEPAECTRCFFPKRGATCVARATRAELLTRHRVRLTKAEFLGCRAEAFPCVEIVRPRFCHWWDGVHGPSPAARREERPTAECERVDRRSIAQRAIELLKRGRAS